MSRITRSISIAVIAIFIAVPSFAADRTHAGFISAKTWQKAEANYINALKVGNEGAKISAAGYLADYKLTGGVPALIAVLKSDKTENVRISAALALVMLDAKEGRDAIAESALYDGSDRVARFCEALLKAHDEKNASIAEE